MRYQMRESDDAYEQEQREALEAFYRHNGLHEGRVSALRAIAALAFGFTLWGLLLYGLWKLTEIVYPILTNGGLP